MRTLLLALSVAEVLACGGCGSSSTPTQPEPSVPALSPFDTVEVVLHHDSWFMGTDFRWTVSTRDTSVTVSPDSSTAVIVYDTRDSLRIQVNGWKAPTAYPYMVCDPRVYVAQYPPQEDSWRVPGATPDPCVRVPTVLHFYQYWWQDPTYSGDPYPVAGHGDEHVELKAERNSQLNFWPMTCEQ